MKVFSASAASAMLASTAIAVPLADLKARQATDIDSTVLQFALTLEHLENVFYRDAVSKFTEQHFIDAGYSAQIYTNLKYIASDERSHVELLTSALTAAGLTPNAPCTYNFPYTDVASFITLSSVIEGVGTGAYLGAASLITSKSYLTVAGSILVTEALHASMQRGTIQRAPAANPYGTPLNPNPVFTLAAGFITSCPSTNAPLPFTAFPALSAMQATATTAGAHIEFSVAGGAHSLPSCFYVTWVSGLKVVSTKPVGVNGNAFIATVPAEAMGQSYAFVTNVNVTGGSLMDSQILFGPSIVEVTPPAP